MVEVDFLSRAVLVGDRFFFAFLFFAAGPNKSSEVVGGRLDASATLGLAKYCGITGMMEL